MMNDKREPFDKIYLQFYEDEYGTFEGPYGIGDEVTWCYDQINDSDPEYLLATPVRKAAQDLLEALDGLIDAMYAFPTVPVSAFTHRAGAQYLKFDAACAAIRKVNGIVE